MAHTHIYSLPAVLSASTKPEQNGVRALARLGGHVQPVPMGHGVRRQSAQCVQIDCHCQTSRLHTAHGPRARADGVPISSEIPASTLPSAPSRCACSLILFVVLFCSFLPHSYGCEDHFYESDTLLHAWESLARIIDSDLTEGACALRIACWLLPLSLMNAALVAPMRCSRDRLMLPSPFDCARQAYFATLASR